MAAYRSLKKALPFEVHRSLQQKVAELGAQDETSAGSKRFTISGSSMNRAPILALLIFTACLRFTYSSAGSQALFMSPLIEECKYEEAKKLSLVDMFRKQANTTAHSGYITVNKTAKSHLFFLFLEAQESPSTAPLLLWTQGGPGLSALAGQFLEDGPLGIDANGNFYNRVRTIQKFVNVIYLDLPVGAGYSFTEDEDSYPERLEDIALAAREFLRQFLLLFADFANRDFYVAGESYAARYAIAIAHNLLTTPNEDVPLRLQGTIGGSGFLGPVFDVTDSSEFLYQVSMLTESERNSFSQAFQTMRQLYAEGDIVSALLRLKNTIFSSDRITTLFERFTLFSYHASALYSELPASMLRYDRYVQENHFRSRIHVSEDAEFEGGTTKLFFSLALDYVRDINDWIEHLLETSKVLLYTGQMDSLFPSPNLRAYFKTLNWTHASEYRSAVRVAWKAHTHYHGFSGYVVQAGNFTEAVLLGAGHFAAMDKPEEAYFLMKNFIEGRSYGSTK